MYNVFVAFSDIFVRVFEVFVTFWDVFITFLMFLSLSPTFCYVFVAVFDIVVSFFIIFVAVFDIFVTFSEVCVRLNPQPVSVLEPISDQKTPENQTATFECKIRINYPEITLSWYKGTQKLESSDKYDIGRAGDRHYLSIRNCQEKDQGSYRVVCGPHIANAKLTVTGRSQCYHFLSQRYHFLSQRYHSLSRVIAVNLRILGW